MDDEKKQEELSLVLPKEDEVRAKVIEEFGFDEETEFERIDKAVEREMHNRKMLSSAIGAKVKLRNEADELRKKIPVPAPEPKPEEKVQDLSTTDIIYLAKTDIDESDVEEVTNYAKTMKVSVKEAHEFFKPILAVRAEQRSTATATNTGTGRRSNAKLSDDAFLSNVEKGNLPDSDEEIQRLVALKMVPRK